MCSFVVGRTFLGITDLVCFERYVGYVQVESSPVWLGLKMSQASPRFLKNDHRDDFLQTIYFTGKMDPVVHHSLYWMHFLPKNMGFFRISMDFLKFPHRKISTKSRLKGSMETVGFEAGAASGEFHGRPTVVGWKKSRSQPPFGCTGDPGN